MHTKLLFFNETHINMLAQAFVAYKPFEIFETYFAERQTGTRKVWIAFYQKEVAGYVTLNHDSLYVPFRQAAIPEIQDLNVLPEMRKKGIGNALLEAAECNAFKKSIHVGLGVGLHADYGDAQKLYIKRGYIPDKRGITYRYQSCEFGESFVLDDDLILWFTKTLL